MKNYIFPLSLVFSLAFLQSCHNGQSKSNASDKISSNYLDSINKADSLANFGPPVELDFSKVLDKSNDNKRVSIEGYVTMPGTSYQTGNNAQLSFIERPNEISAPFNFILSMNVGDGKNTMKSLPDKYKPEDIVVTGKNGEKIGVGDRVKITGKLSVSSDYCSIDCQEIEKVDPVVIDYSQLGATRISTQKPDASLDNKMVCAEGSLEIPTMTVGGDYTFVYLKVPGIADNITIDLAYGNGACKLEPLPENYSENDFKIHDNKGNIINNKKKVRVYGLWKDETIKVESIENI